MTPYSTLKFRVSLKDAIAIRNDLSTWVDGILGARKARKAETDKLKRKRKTCSRGIRG